MKLWEKTYLIYVNSSINYLKFVIKVNAHLFWFFFRLKIDWVNITKLYCLQRRKLTKAWDPQHLFLRHFMWISKIFFGETLSLSVFQMFLNFDWQFLYVRKVLHYFFCATKIIAIKDTILHLKKIVLFLLCWKKKN